MIAPIIRDPVFEHSEIIGVFGLENGSHVTVRAGQEEIGDAQAGEELLVIRLNRPLMAGETLTAIAEKDGVQSPTSVDVRVNPLPVPLPAPSAESVLYIGASCTMVWGLIPGATVRAVSGAELLCETTGSVGNDHTYLYFNRPIIAEDMVQFEESLGNGQSDQSKPIKPVIAHGTGPYAEKLPPPHVNEPQFACQHKVGVSQLMPGAQLRIFADQATVFDYCAPITGGAAYINQILKEGQKISAEQAFVAINLKSEIGNEVIVSPPDKLPAPMIWEPIYEGQRKILIYNLQDSVKVEVQLNGKTIGIPEYVDQNYFDLGPGLMANMKIRARQGLCNRWSGWSNEAIVMALPQEVLPPTLAHPLYPCANYVRVVEKLQGALVKVYADGGFIGESITGLVRVIPSLTIGQRITATQQVGQKVSNHSVSVKVEKLPDGLPQPNIQAVACLDDLIDTHVPYMRVGNLLPGARVNIFWNNLLIGAGEAIDQVTDISLSVQPWPGSKIRALQTLCKLTSADSALVTAIGKLRIVDVTLPKGFLHPNDFGTIKVRSRVVAPADVKVLLTSLNPGVFSVVEPHEIDLLAGQSEIQFKIQAKNIGKADLRLTALNYKQSQHGWSEGEEWFILDINGDVYGLWFNGEIRITPAKHEIKVGDTAEVEITFNPEPADNKCQLVSKWGLVDYPNELILPAGSKKVTGKIKAIKTGTDYIYPKHEYYADYESGGDADTTKCIVEIDPAAAPPLPKTLTKTYSLLLPWQHPANGGKAYVMGKFLPTPGGKLLKVRNINTIWPWQYKLWFPNVAGASTEDAFDSKKGYLLDSGKDVSSDKLGMNPSLVNGLTVVAVPSPMVTPQEGPVYVELTYEVPNP